MAKRRYSGPLGAPEPQRQPQALPRRRSRASRVTGSAAAAIGIVVIALNYAMEVSDVVVLPGGHQELYFGLGVLLTLVGLWFTGLADAR